MAKYLELRSATHRQRIPLQDQPVTIGRHPTNVLALQDARLSRYHCVIEPAGEDVKLMDLGSRNGTRLNGKKITAAAPMKPGDVVRIGGIEITLIDESADLPVAELADSDDTGGDDAEIRLTDEDAPRPKSSRPRKRRPDALAPPPGALSLETDDEPELTPDNVDQVQRQSLNDVVAGLPSGSIKPEQLTLVNARNQRARASKSEASHGIQLLKQLLTLCTRTGASDIHVEPKRDDVQVRLRVDGMMVEATSLHPNIASKLVGVVRVLCDLDITQKNAVQDGHFSAEAPDRRIDYRVSFTPSMHGLKLVIRVLDQATSPQRLDDLRLPSWMLEQIRALTKQDSGMLIVCGPTGSGKTTSLYAGIRGIDASMRNIITIEDPPEYQIDGVTQIPINEQQGNTFSTLLRSVLRQDPDVILLGEIRDPETARIALQAAMTGHLVLSTVHARDTMGTIFRLLDLGVEPYLIASALNLVLSQRLVRVLCEHCKQPAPVKPQQVMKMGRAGEGLKQLYFPAGCERCLNTGYHGRVGVYELLTTNQELRDVIIQSPTMADLRTAINMELFNSLRDSGYRLVAEGKTSLDEIDRVLGSD